MPARSKKGLTDEQRELRERGLRILARMIARAHLAKTEGEGEQGATQEDPDAIRKQAKD